uniref:NADH dehydrogenase subunit 1 n=1 Tax=Heterorhabditis bacteriophora TaxID=37862 RepID=A0A1I7WET6_HETBA
MYLTTIFICLFLYLLCYLLLLQI